MKIEKIQLRTRITSSILVMFFLIGMTKVEAQIWQADNGDGTYKNPIIYADYSDPDVVRVGDDYYMVASSFTCQPGIPVLHSHDLVNWTIINYVYHSLPFERFKKPQHGHGSWAPSIRFHNGRFYVYFCTPDEGLFMASTTDPAKPWTLTHVLNVAQWEDPCPFWDEDGKAYLIHSKLCGGPAIMHRMSADGTKLLDNGKVVYDNQTENPVLEGLKMMKKDGYYYIFAPAGGVPTGWQSVLRSENIYGPYESKKVLQAGNGINGPHQGGFVDTQTGEWWFIHFQDKGVFGRVVLLQPGGWKEGWPVMGVDINDDGVGEPVLSYKKPNVGKIYPKAEIQTNDDFSSPNLGLQWQWQAMPNPLWYSLTANKGNIRLYACQSPTEYGNLYYVPNLLLQKIMAPAFTAITKLTFAGSLPGERAGLTVMGNKHSFICLQKTEKGNRVSLYESGFENCGFIPVEIVGVDTDSNMVWLKVTVISNGTCTYAYSFDGVNYLPIEHVSKLEKGGWIGAKVGVFCLNPNVVQGQGYADFDFFNLQN
ncbi:MAG: glycosyl hydrolase 43 family protein [Bacteroidetes bacterium]|nr:glycosyl hydrolase 43 family protein [Bacteroidota bacterium]